MVRRRQVGLRMLGLLSAALGVAALAPAADDAFTGGLRIALQGAVFPGARPEGETRDLSLEVEAANGKWGRVFGRGLNQGDHVGFVLEAELPEQRLHMKVGMEIGADPWIDGGEGSYVVDLKRSPAGRYEGTYEGTYKSQRVSGKAAARLLPARPVRVKGFKPFEPAEHPRILFRKSDLPWIREKLKTPFGQAFLAAAKALAEKGDPLCLGMLHQVTGQREYAERAMKVVAGYTDLTPTFGAGTGAVGHRFVAVALAYDLCRDAWPEAFRTKLAADIAHVTWDMQKSLQVAGANFNPCSNYYGPGRGAPAIASLALYGDKGDEPVRPASPQEVLTKGDFVARLMASTGQIEKYKADYPRMLAKWRTEHDEWASAGGADVRKLAQFYAGFIHMNRHYREGVGTGGFQAETGAYADIATWYPLVYATFYLKMFGRDVSAEPSIRLLPVRRMMQCSFREGGKAEFLKLSTAAGMRPAWLAAGFPIVPDEYKPGLLWAWRRLCGVTDDKSAANVLDAHWIGGSGLSAALTFLNYPLSTPGAPWPYADIQPAHPSRCMPLTWEAPYFGFYLFRSGWDGRDEFIGQAFLKAHRVGGWNHPNAGTFRLYGLGHSWATGVLGRLGFRAQENVVLLPEDKYAHGDSSFLSCRKAEPDGSGVLTIDMRDFYGGTKAFVPKGADAPRRLPGGLFIRKTEEEITRYVGLFDGLDDRVEDNWRDTGITGLRAMAFDYSGACGAPCLFVLIDKIRGGKKKLWVWQVPRDGSDQRGGEPKVQVAGNTFSLGYGDALLQATFVAPRDAHVRDATDETLLGNPRGRHVTGAGRRVEATGGDDFFVVATVQRKDPPPVKVEGTGLNAAVTVGRRTIRFDGQKILLETGR